MLSQVLSRRPSGRVAAKGGGPAAVDGRGGTVAGGSAAAVAVAERGRAVGFYATVLEEVCTCSRHSRAWDGDCCCCLHFEDICGRCYVRTICPHITPFI